MANRHERRRTAKMFTSTISIEQFQNMHCICAWRGCGKITKRPSDAGWHSMLLYKGQTKLNFLEIENQNMQRDAVLCPEHSAYLDEHLLIDIGGRLRNTMGAA